MDKKEQLYYLLKHFKMGKYDTKTFCDLFTVIFDTDIDKSVLNETELNVFGELEQYTCRFSPYEEDIKKFPNVYHGEDVIREKIDWAIKELKIAV